MSPEPDGAAVDFQRIYEEFRPRIRRYLARLAGGAEAEDLTQETFVRVSRALARFRGESSLATWVYRIATNVATDRRRGAGFQLSVRTAEPAALAIVPTLPLVEQDLARREMSECMRDYINNLPDDCRTVLVLSELEELADRQIAEVLGITVQAAKMRLHRARARLRENLERGCSLSRDERNELICEPRSDDVSSGG
jgi:RNA polymerase sigma-70 factor, ECF subfamily